MRLAGSIIQAVQSKRFEVFYADRGMTGFWNTNRGAGEPIYFTGWYWYVKNADGKAETTENGPFKTHMAALRDCYVRMQLRPILKVSEVLPKRKGNQMGTTRR